MADLTGHWRNEFDNKYLGAWNLFKDGKYAQVTVEVERVSKETIVMQGGRQESAILVYFKDKRIPLILTRTMGKVMQTMYGPVPAAWVGKQVTLYVEPGVRVKDGTADVLRIRNSRGNESLRQHMKLPEGGSDV